MTLMSSNSAESLKTVIEKSSVEELLGPEMEFVPWEAVIKVGLRRTWLRN